MQAGRSLKPLAFFGFPGEDDENDVPEEAQQDEDPGLEGVFGIKEMSWRSDEAQGRGKASVCDVFCFLFQFQAAWNASLVAQVLLK